MNFVKMFLTRKFLGFENSKNEPSYFDNHSHFVNIKLGNPVQGELFGYCSSVDSSRDYKGCIILLHGISDNRKDFVENYHFVQNMRSDYIYLVPEYPGFGESTLSYTKHDCYQSLIKWLDFAITEYNLNNFIMVGQSFGSTLGIDFYDYLHCKGLLVDKPETNVDTQAPEKKNKYYIRKMFFYSPFAKTNTVILEHLHLAWAKQPFSRFLNSLIDDEIEYDLTNLSADLNVSIMTIIYSTRDKIIDSSHANLLKRFLNANYIENDTFDHIELFMDKNIWNDNYNELRGIERKFK